MNVTRRKFTMGHQAASCMLEIPWLPEADPRWSTLLEMDRRRVQRGIPSMFG